MLSLPEDWDYTTKGLAQICKEGVDSISTALKELEKHGYLTRHRIRYKNGQLGDVEYGASQPSGTALRLMQIFETAPEIVSKIAGESERCILQW